MLQLTDGKIIENVSNTANFVVDCAPNQTFAGTIVSNCNMSVPWQWWPYQTIWQSYPVYVCSDKTAKAIEILKLLQAEKKIRCDSVPKFIELVEKLAGIL